MRVHPLHPYTREIFTTSRKGHDRTTQAFGTPTAVWHVGVRLKPRETPAGHTPADNDAAVRAVRDRLNAIAKKLKPDASPRDQDLFELATVADRQHFKSESVNFTVWWAERHTKHAAWLAEWDRRAGPPTPTAGPTDLRVRVQMEVYGDFATVTFFLDAGASWDDKPPPPAALENTRRGAILGHARFVRDVSEGRLGTLGLNPTREAADRTLTDDVRRQLLNSSEYLYSDRECDGRPGDKPGGVWQEFCDAFDLGLPALVGATTDRAGKVTEEGAFEVFVNLRGLVLEAKGRGDAKNPPDSPYFSRFRVEDAADDVPDEMNELVHAYWPFVRRSRSEADYRDWVACGVLDGRGILITALGAQSQYTRNEEEAVGSLPPHLPERLTNGNDGVVGFDKPAPMRYLLLTKGEPDRKQIGRVVDKVNALSTLQLAAFADWDVLRTADVMIREHGRDLDAAMAAWVDASEDRFAEHQETIRAAINAQLLQLREWKATNPDLAGVAFRGISFPKAIDVGEAINTDVEEQFDVHRRNLEALRDNIDRPEDNAAWTPATEGLAADARHAAWARLAELRAIGQAAWVCLRRVKSVRDEDMARVNQTAERRLIQISRDLNDLSQQATGGIQYRINRSRYYAETYRHLLSSMRCGNIETWWTYEQFADRSIDPVFRLIDGIGLRLEKLRERLRSTMESVQTKAIVNQTEATRDNTHQMETIARELRQLAETGQRIQEESARSGTRTRTLTRSVLGSTLILLGFFGVKDYKAFKELFRDLFGVFQ